MRVSDWSSDGFSSDLEPTTASRSRPASTLDRPDLAATASTSSFLFIGLETPCADIVRSMMMAGFPLRTAQACRAAWTRRKYVCCFVVVVVYTSGVWGAQHEKTAENAGLPCIFRANRKTSMRSEEHTSELQSLMRISYAVFCLK